jgi:sulfate adenylyltransferase large subunit/phosphoadenylyl-sulfate reductase (thioredoxin)
MNAIVPISTTVRAASAVDLRPLVRIVIVGHVDHGKSTLIGRLLYETNTLPDGKLEQLKAVSARRGMPFEWSFVLDALQTERDQNITIDTSQIRFRTRSRDFILIDAPGHAEFLRNMITGAAQADAAILVIDATEGVRDQTRRHGYLLQLLGLRHVVVVINKMDRIAYDATRFREIETEITDYLRGLGLTPADVIPVSARDGVGITQHTYTLEWYRPTVVEALDKLSPAWTAPELPLRFPVQAVYKFDARRILAGRVESGRIAVGDEIVVQPSGARTRVKSIEAWPAGKLDPIPHDAAAGQSIGMTLEDALFVERGNLVSRGDVPAKTGNRIRARVFWLHSSALEAGARIGVSVGTADAKGAVTAIHHAIDPGRLAPTESQSIGRNHVGEIEITLDRPIACDPYEANPATGRVVLECDGRIAGGGLVLEISTGAAAVAAPAVQSGRSAPLAELQTQAARLTAALVGLSPVQRIARLRQEIPGKVTFTTSFGTEDQAILHWISSLQADIDVVTLDTGRLFPETYDLWAETERRYGRKIRAIYPRYDKLAELVAQQGINGFYESKDARLACCHVRKVEPLNRALAGANAWITGLRGNQSTYRAGMGILRVDAEQGLLKLNPLFDWKAQAVLDFCQSNGVPTNRLSAKGFASIGCAPCTRAIAPGEPERAGRWWWEQEDKKECGLHISVP